MAIVFSKEQSNVINLRNRNILVSAAAGSGKTTVLVERIIRMISDEEHPVDIDHLLVVTFTKAAAASMREKISDAISKKLEEEYSDHLQRQATLIHHAQITTIDSFCLFILQNNFNDIGLDPGFRVADEGEIRLLKEDIMDRLLEEKLLADKDGSFAHLLDRFVTGNKISNLREILFSLYDRALSYPFPEDWIDLRKKDYEISKDLNQTPWILQIVEYVKRDLGFCREMALQNIEDCESAGGPVNYLPMMKDDLALLDNLLQCGTFCDLHEKMQTITFTTLSRKKDENVDPELKEAVKKQRNELKAVIQGMQKDFFAFSIEDMLEGFAQNHIVVQALCDTLLAFHREFLAVKKEKKMIDFSDMEHFALEILLQKEDDKYVPTKTAKEYREYFHEIMIDEYQDSNLVQEWLLQAISREEMGIYNRFMVGDVKQSIYQFRLARPQIFMEKYDTYQKEVTDNTKLQRIDLAKNYRSRKEVVDTVNYFFYRIMGRDLGNVAYDEDSALYLGADYPDKTDCAVYSDAEYRNKAEETQADSDHALYGNKEAMQEDGRKESECCIPEPVQKDRKKEGMQDIAEILILEKEEGSKNAKEQEALMIASRIKTLLQDYYVTDERTGELRKARYRDIVILLRKTKEWDEVFKTVFEKEGIPAYVTRSAGYFSTGEIRILLNFLKSLDNPKQDIPLYGTMISCLGNFKEEELALIRSKKEASLYENVCKWAEISACENTGLELAQKCRDFLAWFKSYRNQVPYEPIHKILRKVINESGYFYEVTSLPGGAQRLANVQMLLAKAESFEKSSYSGLFHFIRYIDKIQKYDIEFGEAGIMDEQDDVVRIMTIHKSKGLEFPICFLAGCAGQFNTKDAEKAVICDANYGIGLDFLDVLNRVKYKDVRRRFLAKHIIEESLGEEFRILYVALTRAKEKLILSGVCSDFTKLAAGIDGRKRETLLCHFRKRAGAKSYLDWILAAMAYHPSLAEALEEYGYHAESMERITGMSGEMEGRDVKGSEEDSAKIKHENASTGTYIPEIQLSCLSFEMLQNQMIEYGVNQEWNKEILLRQVLNASNFASHDCFSGDAVEEEVSYNRSEESIEVPYTYPDLEQQIYFSYPHKNLADLYVKTSVSELKMAAMHKAYEKESLEEPAFAMYEEDVVNPYIPRFAASKQEPSGSDRGSAYHRLLELVAYRELRNCMEIEDAEASLETEYSGNTKLKLQEYMQQCMERCITQDKITQEEVLLVNKQKILTFLQSPIAKRMIAADIRGDLYKEQPFVLGIDARKISKEFPEQEKVLIQGIIDVYFIEDNEIVLLDYKTDAVNTKDELVKRYKTQLDYYTEALEKITGMHVKERILYSFRLDESILV